MTTIECHLDSQHACAGSAPLASNPRVGNRSQLAIELVDDSQHACVGSANPTEQPQPTRYRELVDDSQYARIGSANLRTSNPNSNPKQDSSF